MTKHGHGLPRKRPGRSAKEAIDADLPELEPIDDLPELEPVDDLPELEPLEVGDGLVTATCVASDVSAARCALGMSHSRRALAASTRPNVRTRSCDVFQYAQ